MDNKFNILNYLNVGFEFEFFSKHNVFNTKKSLSYELNKNIIIKTTAHSNFTPTADVFKIEPDNSGGSGMIELVTGPLPFNTAKSIMKKVFNWIKENGSTNDRCSIHLNISFNKNLNSVNISKLDIGKFILGFNEDYIYDLFPNRKNSVYAKSIKHIFPTYTMSMPSTEKISWKNYTFVNDKYYGVNFTKLTKNYLEFRYVGGKDYETRYNDILKIISHCANSLYSFLIKPVYTKDENKLLDKILINHKKILRSLRTYDDFKRAYPKIKLTINLNDNPQVINTHFSSIRRRLFDILTKGNMKDGKINYDGDTSRLQIKDSNLLKCFDLENVDIVECNIRGNVRNCDIFDSKINDTTLYSCNLFGESVCNNSKIEECYVSINVKCKDCYVFGRNGVFSGIMIKGIFRQGRATKTAKFNFTEIIEIEKIK